MGDSTEDSSNAAHRAQPENGQDRQDQIDEDQGGFFRRIIGVLTHGEDDAQSDEAITDSHPTDAGPGMGNLRNMAVEDVTTPKAEIVSVPSDISKDDLVQVFRDSGMTRLPVFEGTLDTPIGMVHLKDFALKHGFNGKGGRFSLKDTLRPLFYVPPSMPIGVLLQKMQSDRRHMALVIDEYGGVDGLVTIEDLIEQVVGEIEDEHDLDDAQFWTQERPGVYLALAKTPLEEFEAEIGQSLTDTEEVDEEEIDTLGGLVFMLLGRVPVRGEVVEHPAGITIEVTEADPRRIKRLRVQMPGVSDT
ncbi:MAG TPA: hemolysin family protein [Roseovarius sp.]|nr:hemolysin family protein [Roseovarius sp.]